MRAIPIYHLASHARAGETLLLKLMNEHSRVNVPLQITQQEDTISQGLVTEIRETGIESIELTHPYALAFKLTEGQVILVKQGIWQHRYPFRGFALVRNPLSFVYSMLEYNRREGLGWGFTRRKRYAKTYERLLRWSQSMDTALSERLENEPDPIEALCLFYSHRIDQIHRCRLPILRYEDLALDPATALKTACDALQLCYEPTMLQAHERYKATIEGHGMNALDRSVDRTSMDKWRQLPTPISARIKRRTLVAAQTIGYDLETPEFR